MTSHLGTLNVSERWAVRSASEKSTTSSSTNARKGTTLSADRNSSKKYAKERDKKIRNYKNTKEKKKKPLTHKNYILIEKTKANVKEKEKLERDINC